MHTFRPTTELTYNTLNEHQNATKLDVMF